MKRILLFAFLLYISLSVRAQHFIYDSVAVRYSLVSDGGKMLQHNRYISVRPFVDGKAWVKDTTGGFHAHETTIPPSDFYTTDQFGSWGLINRKGKWVKEPAWQQLDSFYDGRAVVGVNKYIYVWAAKEQDDWKMVDSFAGIDKNPAYQKVRMLGIDPHYGMINRKGNYIIQPRYDALGIMINGLILADLGAEPRSRWFAIRADGKGLRLGEERTVRYVLINEKGEIEKKLLYDEVIPLVYITGSTEKYSYWDTTYTFSYRTIPALYQVAKAGKQGVLLYGLINAKGEELIPCKYTRCRDEVLNIVDEDGNLRDSLVETCDPPFFWYHRPSDQFVFFYDDSLTKAGIIIQADGKILYTSSNEEYIYMLNKTDGKITFNRPSGNNYSIEFEYSISKNYDSVKVFYNRTSQIKDMGLTKPMAVNLESETGEEVSTPFYMTNTDKGYGLLNQDLKELIPAEYSLWMQTTDESQFDPNYKPGPPYFYAVPSVNQYVLLGTKMQNTPQEVVLLGADGVVIAKIPDCDSISWDKAKKVYILAHGPIEVTYLDINGKETK